MANIEGCESPHSYFAYEMAICVFLIGPSGVGKTTFGEEAVKKLEAAAFIDLDEQIKRKDPTAFSTAHLDWGKFWNVAAAYMVEIEEKVAGSVSIKIIDVGAGCLQTDNASAFFKNRNTVLLYDSPENVFNRIIARPNNAWIGNTIEDFKSVEYSAQRQKIYGVASLRIDLGALSAEEAMNHFVGYALDVSGKHAN